MDTEEKIVSVEQEFSGKIFDVKKYKVSLPDGSFSFREEVEHRGGASLLVVEDGLVWLVRQYRLSMRAEVIEIPAGKLEAGEDPAVCAARELTEETGLIAEKMTKICQMSPSPGYTNELIHIYYVEKYQKAEQKLDNGEFLNVLKIPAEKCFQMVESGEIFDGKTVVALLWLKDKLNSK